MTQEDQFRDVRDVMRNMVQEAMVPRIADALKERLEEIVGEAPEEKVTTLISDLENFYTDLTSGIIYSPYDTISEGRSLIVGVNTRMPKKLGVNYRRDYETFGEALWDFIEQSEMPTRYIAQNAGVSTKTLYNIKKGFLGGSRKNVAGPFSDLSVRKRLLSIFDIMPKEKKEDFLKLPLKKLFLKP